MAARKRKPSAAATVKTVRAPRGTTSVVKIQAPRMAAAPKAKRRRRHHTGGGGGKGFLGLATKHSRMSIVLAAAALGFAQKQGWLQKLPVVGKAGPITSFGLIGWGAEEIGKMKLPPIVHDMITNALALSAFNLGLSGGQTIVGGDELGAAYQMPGGAVFYD